MNTIISPHFFGLLMAGLWLAAAPRLGHAADKIPTEYADYKTALAHVAEDPNALMLFVGGLNSAIIRVSKEVRFSVGRSIPWQ